MKSLLAVLLTVALFATGFALPLWSAQRSVEDNLIVPGERIGSIRIGMDTAEASKIAVRLFGPIEYVEGGFCTVAEGGYCVYEFGPRGFSPPTPGKAYLVATTDEKFKDKNDLYVGLPAEQFVKAYGQPERVTPMSQYGAVVLEWPSIGFMVIVDVQSKQVGGLAVFIPQPKFEPKK